MLNVIGQFLKTHRHELGHHALFVGSGVVIPPYEREIERLAAILREIEEKLNGGCIRNNSELDRFGDPYLRDGLTADILNAMYYLVVYPDDDFLPDLGARTKCDMGVYGYTPGNKEYVMICLRKGADGLTLLHELEHYVDPNTTECRAPWVAQWCYGCPTTIPCPTCSD